ncbi:TetR/AcrR family transcriptional regulator [Paenibacillus sp. J22TS3]|uniref:TetR/AcrR family transcriptional regulator n=1 Tax=Paenibacillus sp. J22TS3 TaxID=2807192 RepID=UPI001B0F321D|nr:TetR/AcrR family transcriptional regulator [Paenibacillus sp. J22TS3]GIP21975.1 hypothetical protein J22TS3_22500 [Paenibacillus sp. J22TS3]
MTPKDNSSSKSQLHDERREQIKQAALKVFARRGLEGTKMSMIAAEAGVSDGLSYRYFKSKDEIFALLIREAIQGSIEAMEMVGQSEASPLERFRSLTVEMLEDGNNYYFVLMQQAMSAESLPNEVAKQLQSYSVQGILDLLTPIFIAGQKEGIFIDGDPGELVMWYLTVVSSLMLIDVSSMMYGYSKPDTEFLLRLIVKDK